MTAPVPDPTAPRRFRKKPVVIEALPWTVGIDDAERFVGGREFIRHKAQTFCDREVWNSKEKCWVTCPEGHWIIKGVAGEFYPCAPDVFAATYEPVAPASDDTRDRAHSATDVMREAEAWVAYLRQYVVNNPDRDLETAVDGIAAVIRALMERVNGITAELEDWIMVAAERVEKIDALYDRIAALEAEVKFHLATIQNLTNQVTFLEGDDARIKAFQRDLGLKARIAALEAEVELMADKISAAVILRMVEHVSLPTPAEIAARVEQNRKEERGR